MSAEQPRLFAVIPAAGVSRRMGQPKLLLPLGGRPVIVRLLDVLDRPDITETVVVIRPDDDELAEVVESTGARIVRPAIPPPDMRTSVSAAIESIESQHRPTARDAWLLVPADHPVLDHRVLDAIIDRWRTDGASPLVPTCHGRRGHPTLFGWTLANQLDDIPADRGLNWLVEQLGDQVEELELGLDAVIADLDTPEDYRRLEERFRDKSG